MNVCVCVSVYVHVCVRACFERRERRDKLQLNLKMYPLSRSGSLAASPLTPM